MESVYPLRPDTIKVVLVIFWVSKSINRPTISIINDSLNSYQATIKQRRKLTSDLTRKMSNLRLTDVLYLYSIA